MGFLFHYQVKGEGGKIIHKACWWMVFLCIVRWGEEKTIEVRLNPKKVEVESVEEGKAWQLSTYLDHVPFERIWGGEGGVEAHGMLFKLLGTYLSFGTWIEDLSRQEKSHIPNHGCCPSCFEVLGFMTDSSSFVCVLCDALASVAVSNWELSINFQFTTKVGAKTSLDPSYFVL